MKKVVLLSYNLRPGTDIAAFEAFMRERDYPVFRNHPLVKAYTSYRIPQLVQGSVTFTHFDLLEVADFADFAAIFGDSAVQAHAGEWLSRWSEHGLDADPSKNFTVAFCEEI
jgi:hypothetical protein